MVPYDDNGQILIRTYLTLWLRKAKKIENNTNLRDLWYITVHLMTMLSIHVEFPLKIYHLLIKPEQPINFLNKSISTSIRT